MIGLRFLRRAISFLLIAIVAFPLYVAASIWWVGTHPAKGKADLIVVLGAAQYNGRPGAILTARLQHALTVYQSGQVSRVITTGSRAPGDVTTEAAVGERWLSVRGVKRAIAVPVGRDTYASTVAYTKYMKTNNFKSAIIVTDPWHCYRARAMARSLGITAGCSPSTTGPGVPATRKYFQREILGYLAFTFLGPSHSWSMIKSLESSHG